ncbi:hypothetical protein MK852_06560 [Shewanella benthica]|uniref:hypothetical protein n=1 Tax=Shewanella benthica TaxID=43661 RepID=UPI00187A9525|nr:hypothetical protein [Shewanella benthica]MBE7213893.1 hypothetical protein [Shewanella benthica]MCL1061799.1 hypothetical protein [Shewanella benthica]
MAKSQRKLSTSSVLIIFLLSLAVFVLSSLYLETRHKNELLLLDVERLQQSQVLLMVPDEQAQALATWMAQHPEATQTLVSQVKQGEKVTLEVGPGVNNTDVQTASAVASPLALVDEGNTQVSVPLALEHVPLQYVPLDPVPLKLSAKPSDGTHKQPQVRVEQAISLIANDLSLDDVSETLSNVADTMPKAKASTLSVDEDGVKVISLPHGGIRVTTRDNN